jgi:hypothetical protein
MTSTDNRRMRSAEEGAGRVIGIFSLIWMMMCGQTEETRIYVLDI